LAELSEEGAVEGVAGASGHDAKRNLVADFVPVFPRVESVANLNKYFKFT
jgi:hypothetical protein